MPKAIVTSSVPSSHSTQKDLFLYNFQQAQGQRRGGRGSNEGKEGGNNKYNSNRGGAIQQHTTIQGQEVVEEPWRSHVNEEVALREKK